MTLDRHDIVAAAFASAGPGATFDPIQAQIVLFLVNDDLSKRIGRSFFAFRPYTYCPFDPAVDEAIQRLVDEGDARSAKSSAGYPLHSLTESGHRRGADALGSLPDSVADYFRRASTWVLLVPYRRVIEAVYREFPEMAVPAVKRRRRGGPRNARARNPFMEGMASAFDLFGMGDRPRQSADGFRADGDALRSDWEAVGADLENAMVQLGEDAGLW